MLIIAFCIALLMVLLLDSAVVYDFLRYRYKGDKVPLILAVFALGIIATTVFTITLLDSSSSPVQADSSATSIIN